MFMVDRHDGDTIARLRSENERLTRRVAEQEQTIQTLQHDMAKLEQRLDTCASDLRLFKTLVENAPDSILVAGVDGVITYANPAGRAMAGYDAALIGMHIDDVYQDVAAMTQQWYRRLTTEGFWRGEVVQQRQDGKRFIVQGVLFGIYDAQGQLQAVAGIGHDVTEQKQVEEASHIMVDHSLQGLAIYQEGRCVLTNAAAARITGYSVEEMLAMSPEEAAARMHPDDRELVLQCVRECQAGHSVPQHDEFRIFHKDGSVRCLEAYATQAFYRGKPAVHMAYIDITDRKHIEEELKRQQQFLRQVLDINPSLIFARDRAGRFTLVNQTLADVYGSTVDALLGKTDADLGLQVVDVEQLRAEDGIVLANHAELVVPERQIHDASGRTRWLSLVKRPILAPDGSADQVLVVATDITGRKQAEDALQQANTDLRRMLHELEQRNQETAMLNELGHLFLSSLKVEDVYTATARFCRLLFRGQPGALYILDSDDTLLHAVCAWGKAALPAHTLVGGTCWALQHGQPYVRLDDRRSGLCANEGNPVPPGYVCLPIVVRDVRLGILQQSLAALPDSERFVPLAESIARQIGLTLANLRLRARLREQAIRDALTGLFNRRFLDESLERELHRAGRQQRPVGVMMLDIDHFKHFNDSLGHEAGDAVLNALGTFLQTQVRGSDIACRYGGEEFTLVLPDATLEDTRRRAEALRSGVQHLRLEHAGRAIGSITVSVGVAVFPEHGTTPERLIQAADEALYRAKVLGRDRVVVAGG